MKTIMRLCELEVKIVRETFIINGGIHIIKVKHDGDLSAIKVINTNYINGNNNDELVAKDEWLYTLFVKSDVITGGVADCNYVSFIYDKLNGIHIKENDYIG